MITMERDEQLVATAAKHLDDQAASLPAHALRRLQTARQQALAGAVMPHRPWFALPRWVTAGGLATAAVMVLTVSLWVGSPGQQGDGINDELERIATQEQMDLYEDLEFFRWLAEDN